MSTILTINIRNDERQAHDFFVFQQPATYPSEAMAYSNSLFSARLGNYGDTGATLTFRAELRFYAGLQQSNTLPHVGNVSGDILASRPIDLASGSGTENDSTTAIISEPIGLTQPVNGDDVKPGAFRITTPVFTSQNYYNAGLAVNANGQMVLSNFIVVDPATETDCQPVLKYFVGKGEYAPGTVINFTHSSLNAALCDFTGGITTVEVANNANGTWSVFAG